MTDLEAIRAHFRVALRADPGTAFRDWFRAQEDLRHGGEADCARALADDLWGLVPELSFPTASAGARFLHGAAVFYGSPGPAADLSRARALFARALDRFADASDEDGLARARHNLATAISNLGTTPGELSEAAALFARALEWRNDEREIARGVSLHNLGIALRRLAELDPSQATEHLAASADALREAIALRRKHALAEGEALSERHLEETLARLARTRSR